MELLHAKWLKLWFLWIVAIALGSPRVGEAIAELLTSKIYFGYASPLFFFLFIALFLLLSGGISGIAQWLVLRTCIDISGWQWIFTTILEGIISIYLLDTDIASSYAAFIIYSGIIGLLIGSLQWLILRRRINSAGWWILILVAGHIISAVVVVVIVILSPSAMYRMEIFTTIVYGALTGAGLVFLLIQSSKAKMSANVIGSSSQVQ